MQAERAYIDEIQETYLGSVCNAGTNMANRMVAHIFRLEFFFQGQVGE